MEVRSGTVLSGTVVGNIVDLGSRCRRDILRHIKPNPPQCAGCLAFMKMIRDHKAEHDAARSFADEAAANSKLWEILG